MGVTGVNGSGGWCVLGVKNGLDGVSVLLSQSTERGMCCCCCCFVLRTFVEFDSRIV